MSETWSTFELPPAHQLFQEDTNTISILPEYLDTIIEHSEATPDLSKYPPKCKKHKQAKAQNIIQKDDSLYAYIDDLGDNNV